MKTNGALRLVISPSEARSLLNYLQRQGVALPDWTEDWDGESNIWLPDVEVK